MSDNPYAAPAAHIQEIQSADDALLPSSRSRRLGAQCLNAVCGVLLVAVGGFAGAFVFYQSQSAAASSEVESDAAAAILISVSICAAIWIGLNLYLLAMAGQSVGKKLLGIRVARLDGTKPSLGRLVFLRYLLPRCIAAIPLLGAVFVLADYLLIFGEARRCVHDYMADTQVVMTNAAKRLPRR